MIESWEDLAATGVVRDASHPLLIQLRAASYHRLRDEGWDHHAAVRVCGELAGAVVRWTGSGAEREALQSELRRIWERWNDRARMKPRQE